VMLENLRYYPAEEDPSVDENFAKQLSCLADFYVNDAFGAAHRSHSSITVITQYFPRKAAMGLLMEQEVRSLTPLLHHPARPFFVIAGGAKISTKIPLLTSLMQRIDALYIGGAMAWTFLKARGAEVGSSPVDTTQIKKADEVMQHCFRQGVTVHLPTDVVIGRECSNQADSSVIQMEDGIPPGWMGMDIGPATLQKWTTDFQRAATIFWNGPLGVCEWAPFSAGTTTVAQTVAKLQATTIVGGGDSAAVVCRLGLRSKFTHVSTGGGASLKFLEVGYLPGIEALSDRSPQK
jgi:phosphoglycerate kinase